jgi:hypothetical protein
VVFPDALRYAVTVVAFVNWAAYEFDSAAELTPPLKMQNAFAVFTDVIVAVLLVTAVRVIVPVWMDLMPAG